MKQTGLPCFVKPNASGSSFGVTKVKKEEEFDEALEKAFAEGHEVLVESFMKGTEVACGVVKTKQRKIVMPVTEIVPKKEFFDYRSKIYRTDVRGDNTCQTAGRCHSKDTGALIGDL